jgi:hypothetical protein
VKFIKLSSQPENKDWSMQFVDDHHYDVCYSEDVTITKPNGEPLMVLLKNALSQESVARAWAVLKKVNPVTENRGTASGINAVPRTKVDGTKSSTTRVPKGWEVMSGIVGYFERIPRFPYTHACAWNQKNPDKFAELFPMVKEVNSLFEKHIPDRYAVQKGYVDRTPKEYIIPGSVFTTLTINKNFRTACHKDAGDLESGFSCLSVIRQGKFNGGRLVLPNWRISAELDTFDVIMFDAHEFHGNTQIVPLTKDATRCSVVYYYREKMVHSLPPDQEVEWAKNRKAGEPLYATE